MAGHGADENEVRDGIRRFILDEITFGELPGLRGDEALLSGGLVPSFHLLQLATFIEDQFGVRVPDEDLVPEVFDTLDELTAYVVDRRR